MKILEPKTLQFLSISWAISSIGLVTKPPVPNITPHPFERSPWYSQVLCLPYRILPLDRRFPQTLVILPSTMPLGLFLPDLSATWFLNSISFHKQLFLQFGHFHILQQVLHFRKKHTDCHLTLSRHRSPKLQLRSLQRLWLRFRLTMSSSTLGLSPMSRIVEMLFVSVNQKSIFGGNNE